MEKHWTATAGRGRNARKNARRAGFTLMEMIIVMVILAAVVAVVVPNLGTGLGGTRAQIAARGLVQMSRYARSMALANQTGVELVVSSNGILRVRAAAGSVNFAGRGEMEGDAYGNAAMASAQAMASSGGGSARQESTASLESSIALEKKFEQANFTFEGYTDGLGRMLTEREGGGVAREGSESVVAFRSNGVCKPCRFSVSTPNGITLHVTLGTTGKGKVENER